MIVISNNVSIPENEIELNAVRAQGPGGQKVNKTSSAVHLRFDITASSLPDYYKSRLLALKDQHINNAGVVVIKAQQHRSQQKNREEALDRLQRLVQSVKNQPKRRVQTKPSPGSRQKRLDSKTRHSRLKQLRQKVTEE